MTAALPSSRGTPSCSTAQLVVRQQHVDAVGHRLEVVQQLHARRPQPRRDLGGGDVPRDVGQPARSRDHRPGHAEATALDRRRRPTSRAKASRMRGEAGEVGGGVCVLRDRRDRTTAAGSKSPSSVFVPPTSPASSIGDWIIVNARVAPPGRSYWDGADHRSPAVSRRQVLERYTHLREDHLRYMQKWGLIRPSHRAHGETSLRVSPIWRSSAQADAELGRGRQLPRRAAQPRWPRAPDS